MLQAIFLIMKLPERGMVVRRILTDRITKSTHTLNIVDVGGRLSPYTLDLPAKVTVTELPRETDLQKKLKLGLDDDIEQRLRKRRNIEGIVLDDMTRTSLPQESADIITAVEVLEHVENDHAFVVNIASVLKEGGLFVATTPNGDCIPNHNPDHIRHYTKDEMIALLKPHFRSVNVLFAVQNDTVHKWGRKSIQENPAAALLIFYSRIKGWLRTSSQPYPDTYRYSTANLVAICEK